MNNTNNMSARESFQIAKQLFVNAFSDKFPGDLAGLNRFVNGLKLSQSEIRLEVALNTTATQFTFGVTPNQQNTNGVNFPLERRLQQQDSFVCNEYGIFVAKTTGDNDRAFQLLTYGNTQVFTVANEANAIDANFFCSGSFELKVNNDVVMPYRGLFNHWYKPQTQQTDALGAGSPKDQLRGAEDGMITNEPNILFIGTKNNVPSINLPTAMAAATNVRAVLILRGILAQNSTVTS